MTLDRELTGLRPLQRLVRQPDTRAAPIPLQDRRWDHASLRPMPEDSLVGNHHALPAANDFPFRRARIPTVGRSGATKRIVVPAPPLTLPQSPMSTLNEVCRTLCRSAATPPHERFVDVTPNSLRRGRPLQRLVRPRKHCLGRLEGISWQWIHRLVSRATRARILQVLRRTLSA